MKYGGHKLFSCRYWIYGSRSKLQRILLDSLFSCTLCFVYSACKRKNLQKSTFVSVLEFVKQKNVKDNFERCMHHRFLFVVLEDLAYVCLHYSEHKRQCLHQKENGAISILLCEVKYVLPQHSHLKK